MWARGRSATARTASAMCLLADQRDGVDADPLAAQVVAVRLAHRAEAYLRDLRAAADHDHALAEDLAERLARLDLGHAWQPGQRAPPPRAESRLRISKSKTRTRPARRGWPGRC